MTLRREVERLVALMRKRRLDRELEGEILAHLELAERDAWRAVYRRGRPAPQPAAASEESNK